MSAGPDEVRQAWIPIITTRLMRITQRGLFQSFGHNRIVHHFDALTNLKTSLIGILLIPILNIHELSCLHKYLRSECFAGSHHGPDDPSEFVSHRYGY